MTKVTEGGSATPKLGKEVETLNPCGFVSNGTSIFTACMDRGSNLVKALSSWLSCDEVDEIVIVDWSSKSSLWESVKDFKDKRVLFAYVPDREFWIASMAFNLAFRLTSRSKVVKLDADIVIKKDFFRRNKLIPNTFLSGNCDYALTRNQRSLHGSMMVQRDDFLAVNGYDERLRFYAWEDTDLYNRLRLRGIKWQLLDFMSLSHLKHSNAARLGRQPVAQTSPLVFHTYRNISIVRELGLWHSGMQLSEFDFVQTEKGICCRLRKDPNSVSEEVLNRASKRAREMASFGLSVNPFFPLLWIRNAFWHGWKEFTYRLRNY